MLASRPLRRALAAARSMAVWLTSTQRTKSAPPAAAFRPKGPTWQKQSSTRRPPASSRTARRLYFWSRKKPVFWLFSMSRSNLRPFSTTMMRGVSGTLAPWPSHQPLYWGSPSLAREGESLRS